MDDAEYREVKARVEGVFMRWRYALGLGYWRVNLEWSRERDATLRESDASANKVSTTAARTFVSWPYLEATIEFFLPAFVGMEEDRVEYIVLHECMHILVNEMRWVDGSGENIEHEERVCTNLGHAFGWVAAAAASGDLFSPHRQADEVRDYLTNYREVA